MKGKQVAIIALVLVIFGCIATVGILSGTHHYSQFYVCLESVARLECISDSHGVVTSYRPINQEGKIICSGMDIVGKPIDSVVQQYIDVSQKAGYMDVDGDNVIKITVLAGLTQAYENRVVRAAYKKCVDTNMYTVICENQDDLANFNAAKNFGVSSDKYDLMLALSDSLGVDMNNIKKYSTKRLIDILSDTLHASTYSPNEYTSELNSRLESNSDKYNAHMQLITATTTKQFRQEYAKYLEANTHAYNVDFEGELKRTYKII